MNKTSELLVRSMICGVAVLMLVVVESGADVPGIIYKKGGGTPLKGMIRWQPASKVYVLTSRNVSTKIPGRSVDRVQVKEPKGWKTASQYIAKGKHAAAIPLLEKILQDYAMLQWDARAAKALAECYLGRDPKKAVAMCEKVTRNNPAAAVKGDLAEIYWKALLKADRTATLRKLLITASSSGNRTLEARALLMRGDMEMKKGNLRDALTDGYLRVITLYKQEKSVQGEALFNAVQCFRELGQHAHAEKMRKELVTKYPRDSYARKIQAM